MEYYKKMLVDLLRETINTRYDGTPYELPKERASKEKRFTEKINFLQSLLTKKCDCDYTAEDRISFIQKCKNKKGE